MEREATRDRMATASLARLNTPDPDPATFQNHAAFALNNLTPLTTRPQTRSKPSAKPSSTSPCAANWWPKTRRKEREAVFLARWMNSWGKRKQVVGADALSKNGQSLKRKNI